MKNNINNYKAAYVDSEIQKILGTLDDDFLEKFLKDENGNTYKKQVADRKSVV